MTVPSRDLDPAGSTLPSWGAVSVLAVLAALPVIYFRIRLPAAADLGFHLAIAGQYARGVAEGHWYPRWYGDFNLGWGSPTGYFYPPALSALTAFFSWIAGGRLVAGLTASLGVYSFVGASGVYALARALNAGRYAWLAVVLWLLTPFRAFELFSSGLMSSFAGGGVAAWVLVTLHRLEVAPPSEKARALSFCALAYGALALTNLPYAVMAAYMVAAWVAVRSASRAELSGSLRIVGAGALGAAVASVYVLPMLVHRPEMYVPQTTPFEWWRINFLFDSDAHLSPRLRVTLENTALLPAAGLVLSLAILGVLRRSGRIDGTGASTGVRLLATFGLVALVLTTPLTAVLWATLPVLKDVQFPWRLLEVVAVPCAVLVAVAMRVAVSSTIKARSAPGRASDLAVVALAGGLVLVCVLAALSFRSVSQMTARVEAFHSGALSGADLARTFHGRMAFFLPITAADPTTLPDQPLVLPLTPGCDVSVESWGQAERVFTVRSDERCDLALRTYDFPGWKAERVTEGGTAPLQVSADPEGGRLLVSVPEREARIRVWFASGWPTALGALLTLVALAVCAALLRRPASSLAEGGRSSTSGVHPVVP